MNNGICVVQTFEPKPLYSALADLGFEYETEKVSEQEYRAYFYRTELKTATYESGADMPFKPTAILNYKLIDDTLAGTVVDFWEFIWEKEGSAIDLKTKLLLSEQCHRRLPVSAGDPTLITPIPRRYCPG